MSIRSIFRCYRSLPRNSNLFRVTDFNNENSIGRRESHIQKRNWFFCGRYIRNSSSSPKYREGPKLQVIDSLVKKKEEKEELKEEKDKTKDMVVQPSNETLMFKTEKGYLIHYKDFDKVMLYSNDKMCVASSFDKESQLFEDIINKIKKKGVKVRLTLEGFE